MESDPQREAGLPSDRELVFQWKAGSMSAFESLVRRYQPRLLSFLERRLGNRQDAEDATQRTFLSIHQGINRYRDETPFASWAFMIARRQAINLLRSKGSRERVQEQLVVWSRAPEDAAPSPLQTLDQRERAGKLWQWARGHLSEQAFTALWLHVQEDMSDADIARTMRLTRTHVRVVLHRARKKLIALRACSESAADPEPRSSSAVLC